MSDANDLNIVQYNLLLAAIIQMQQMQNCQNRAILTENTRQPSITSSELNSSSIIETKLNDFSVVTSFQLESVELSVENRQLEQQKELIQIKRYSEETQIHSYSNMSKSTSNIGPGKDKAQVETQLNSLKSRIKQLEKQLDRSQSSQRSKLMHQNQKLQEQLHSTIKQLQHKNMQIQALTIENSLKNAQFNQLIQQYTSSKNELERFKLIIDRYQQIITMQEQLAKNTKTIIKQVPVYIQKDVLVEVAVPIYIKQKLEPKKFHQLTINNEVFQEENSFAINQLSADFQQSQGNQQTKKSNFKFGNCKSYQQSDIEQVEKSSIQPEKSKTNARLKRIRQIVQVPVYIEKQVIKVVQKEVIIQKEVIVQKQVIRYLPQEQKQIPLPVHNDNIRITFDESGYLIDGSQIYENQLSFQVNKTSSVCLDNDQNAFIQEQSQQSQNQAKGEIIIQVPVEIEKPVLVIKEIIMPIEIPVQIMVQVVRQVIVEKEIIVEKVVVVQKIIEKIVPHEIIVQKIVPLDINPSQANICKDLKIVPNLPQEISFHFDLSSHLAIQKILVTEHQSEKFLRPSHTQIHEFIQADQIMEALIVEILEIPVEIMLDDQTKHYSHAEVQADLEISMPEKKSNCQNCVNNLENHHERPYEIIVQKVIYVYGTNPPNKSGIDESIITLMNLPTNNYHLGKQRDQIIIEKVVEIEKPVYIDKVLQVQKVAYQILPVQIATQIIIFSEEKKEDIVEPQQIIDDIPMSIQLMQMPQQSLNICVHLTDRSSSEQERPYLYRQYSQCEHHKINESKIEFQENQENQNLKCQLLRYEELQQELNNIKIKFAILEKVNEQLQNTITQTQTKNHFLQVFIQQLQDKYQNRVYEIKQAIVQSEDLKRQALAIEINSVEAKLSQAIQLLHQKINENTFYEQRLKIVEAQKCNEQLEFIRQIQLKDSQIDDILYQNQIQNEQIKHLKHYQSRILQEQSNLQQQINHLKKELTQKKNIEGEMQMQMESKLIDIMKQAEQLRTQSQLKMSTMEELYQNQIQQLIQGKNQAIQEKDSQIEQLSAIISQLRSQKSENKKQKGLESKSQKINVKIINMQNKSESMSTNKDPLQQRRQKELYHQNQRLLQVIENLNQQINYLNDQIYELQMTAKYDHKPKTSDSDQLYLNRCLNHGMHTSSPETQIKIQQINGSYQFCKPVSASKKCFCYENDANDENSQIQQLKELLVSYEKVIKNLEQNVQTLQRRQSELLKLNSYRQQQSYYQNSGEGVLAQYQMYRIRYYKILEISQLIKQEVLRVEREIPRRYLDLLNNIKRFLKVIESNQNQLKNSQTQMRGAIAIRKNQY